MEMEVLDQIHVGSKAGPQESRKQMTEIVSDGQLQYTINQGRCALSSNGQGWKLGKMKDMANARH